MMDTPFGIFEDHWEYCHYCNNLRGWDYSIIRFTNVMILPKEPVKYFPGPDRIMEPPKVSVLGFEGYAR